MRRRPGMQTRRKDMTGGSVEWLGDRNSRKEMNQSGTRAITGTGIAFGPEGSKRH
jgi:hypothetical protein